MMTSRSMNHKYPEVGLSIPIAFLWRFLDKYTLDFAKIPGIGVANGL